MDNRIFLQSYRLSRGRNGLPVELYRTPAARTYRAQEIETGREVALTLVASAPNDADLLAQLEARARAAKQINHVSMPRLHHFGRELDELIYATDYCEGHTAAAWVAARGPLAIAAVLRVALQVVDAMSATAFQRLHHSALNPDNIIFVAGQAAEEDGPTIKVLHWFVPPADFSNAGNERIDTAMRFAAPEQLQSGQVDVRTEIYSLGATMWFLLTGTAPGVNPPEESVARAGAKKLRGVPKIVRHLLNRMLRLDPAERPQDPVALAAYLQTCLARVERREKIERRLGVPLLANARMAVAQARMPVPIPIKPLAWATAIVALAALAVLFVPWPLGQKRTVTVAPETTDVPQTWPNEFGLVQKDSLGRMSEAGSIVPPVSAPVAFPQPNDESLRDGSAGPVAGSSPVGEPAPPEEGPLESPAPPPTLVAANALDAQRSAEIQEAVEASQSAEVEQAAEALRSAEVEQAAEAPQSAEIEQTVVAQQSAETILPVADSDAAEAVIPEPVIAEAAPLSAPPEPTLLLEEEEPVKVAQSTPPPKKLTKPSQTKRTTKKRAVASKSTRSKASTSKSRSVARPAKRARPLPKLHVGSARAELVGTTAEGKWILSVADSGKRVIVPPPPGYGN